jgi:hypothetical protein
MSDSSAGAVIDTQVPARLDRLPRARFHGLVVMALRERGASGRGELGRAVGVRQWGPGRFGESLRVARAQGQARRVARARYEASSRGQPPQGGGTEGSTRDCAATENGGAPPGDVEGGPAKRANTEP